MTGWVRQILERYGQKVTVQTGETTVDVRAFLQPVPERSERAREEATHTQADIHELDTGYLAACRESDLQAAQALGWKPIACMDGERLRPVEEIHEEIWSLAAPLLGAASG